MSAFTRRHMTRRWLGRWILGVGVLHCVYALAVFGDPLLGILRDGLFDAVETVAARTLAFWFFFAGLLLILLGSAMDWLEAQPTLPLPRVLGYGLLGLVMLGCIAIPVSGFWALVPPALGAAWKARPVPA